MESPSLHWRLYDERYLLVGNKCNACGKEIFPRRLVCPYCKSRDLQEKEMPREGIIESFTKIHVAISAYELRTPYYLAIIRLSNGVKVTAEIVDSEEEKIKIGAKVKAVFRKIVDVNDSSVIHYGYKFVVVD